jgi:hypothetical protein
MCCIAGATEQFFGEKDYYFSMGFVDAPELLGLERSVARELFMPEYWMCNPEIYTPPWAARCIRKLIKTGEVDWVGTREEVTK